MWWTLVADPLVAHFSGGPLVAEPWWHPQWRTLVADPLLADPQWRTLSVSGLPLGVHHWGSATEDPPLGVRHDGSATRGPPPVVRHWRSATRGPPRRIRHWEAATRGPPLRLPSSAPKVSALPRWTFLWGPRLVHPSGGSSDGPPIWRTSTNLLVSATSLRVSATSFKSTPIRRAPGGFWKDPFSCLFALDYKVPP